MGETQGGPRPRPHSLGLDAALAPLERGEKGGGPPLEVFVQVEDEGQLGPLVMGCVIHVLLVVVQS